MNTPTKWRRAVTVILFFVALSASQCSKAGQLSVSQSWAASYARSVGGKWGETLRGIIGQEQSYCADHKVRDPLSYGCGQLRLSTAQRFKAAVTAQQLTQDRRLNIQLAAAYLVYCMDQTHSWRQGVACYHYGLPVAISLTTQDLETDPYVEAVITRMVNE